MTEVAATEAEELKTLCPNAALCEEGGVGYILLPRLRMPDGCPIDKVDALLCPTPQDGYEFRIFFSEIVPSKVQLNWNKRNVRILDRSWFAFSWKSNRRGLRLAQMVVEIVTALSWK